MDDQSSVTLDISNFGGIETWFSCIAAARFVLDFLWMKRTENCMESAIWSSSCTPSHLLYFPCCWLNVLRSAESSWYQSNYVFTVAVDKCSKISVSSGLLALVDPMHELAVQTALLIILVSNRSRLRSFCLWVRSGLQMVCMPRLYWTGSVTLSMMAYLSDAFVRAYSQWNLSRFPKTRMISSSLEMSHMYMHRGMLISQSIYLGAQGRHLKRTCEAHYIPERKYSELSSSYACLHQVVILTGALVHCFQIRRSARLGPALKFETSERWARIRILQSHFPRESIQSPKIFWTLEPNELQLEKNWLMPWMDILQKAWYVRINTKTTDIPSLHCFCYWNCSKPFADHCIFSPLASAWREPPGSTSQECPSWRHIFISTT